MKVVTSVAASVFALCLSSPAFASEPSCSMTRAIGLSEADSQAVEDVVCQVARERAPDAKHYVRLSAIGGRYVLTVLQERNGVVSEKQAVLSGIDEVVVASPRLLEALNEQKRLEDTQTVTNITAQEARVAKKKASEIHGGLGVIGVGAFTGEAQGGAQFAITAGSPTLSFVADLRIAGDVASDTAKMFSLGIIELSEERTMGYASASSGARHHFTESDFSPFVGGGIAFASLSTVENGIAQKNSGMAGYAEVGLEMLRTSTMGGAIGIRFDAPAFELKGLRRNTDGTAAPVRSYSPLVAAAVSLRF